MSLKLSSKSLRKSIGSLVWRLVCSDFKHFSGVFINANEYKSNDGEHPVEFFEVYREYLRRFEGKIEQFIVEVSVGRAILLN